MGQNFHVLRCFSCHTFQVQQVKKVNRWSCKLCGQKQSVLKEFGRGSGADCRRHVQKLNAMRGAVMEEEEAATWSLWQQTPSEDGADQQVDVQVSCSQVSLWNKYLDPPQEVEPEDHDPDENVVMDRQQLHNNWTNKKRKRIADERRQEQNTDCSRPDRTSSWTSPRPPSISRSSSASLTRTGPRAVTGHRSSSQSTICPLGVNSADPSSLTKTGPPSGFGPSSSGGSGLTGSRWTRFLGAACPEGEELDVGGVISGSGDVSLPPSPSLKCVSNAQQAPPLSRPRPLLPVSSLFDSGDDFSFSNMF